MNCHICEKELNDLGFDEYYCKKCDKFFTGSGLEFVYDADGRARIISMRMPDKTTPAIVEKIGALWNGLKSVL